MELKRATERVLKHLYRKRLNSSLLEDGDRGGRHREKNDDLPVIYVVTPTYARVVQKADLTRLANTLLHVRRLHWIVVDDAASKAALVTRLLQRSGIAAYEHLCARTPVKYQRNETDRHPARIFPKGVEQRNAGIKWIRNRIWSSSSSSASSSSSSSPSTSRFHGVVYFADDDNAYDLQIFEEVNLFDPIHFY